jgi:hypothetical protein
MLNMPPQQFPPTVGPHDISTLSFVWEIFCSISQEYHQTLQPKHDIPNTVPEWQASTSAMSLELSGILSTNSRLSSCAWNEEDGRKFVVGDTHIIYDEGLFAFRLKLLPVHRVDV